MNKIVTMLMTLYDCNGDTAMDVLERYQRSPDMYQNAMMLNKLVDGLKECKAMAHCTNSEQNISAFVDSLLEGIS